MDGWMNIKMDERMEGWMDGQPCRGGEATRR